MYVEFVACIPFNMFLTVGKKYDPNFTVPALLYVLYNKNRLVTLA